jgi:hypothetical protein
MHTTVTRPVSTLPRGITFGRLLVCHGLSNGHISEAKAIAEQHYSSTPTVSRSIELSISTKTAVQPYAIAIDGAIGPLPNQQTGIAQEVLSLLAEVGIFDSLRTRMRRVPFLIPVPRSTSDDAAGEWVGEGRPAPLISNAFDTVALGVRKRRTIWVVAKELVRWDRSSEIAVRDVGVGRIAKGTDVAFLDPTIAGTSESPASITFAGTAVTSTGTTAAQMTADFGALINAITTSGSGLVWIMRPTTAARVALVLGAAASDLPRTLFGLPVILSGNSPQQVTLADLAQIAYADSGDVEVEAATHAAIEMSDAPTNYALSPGSPGDIPVGAQLCSLWENNLIGYAATRYINWEVVQAGAVAYMVVAY